MHLPSSYIFNGLQLFLLFFEDFIILDLFKFFLAAVEQQFAEIGLLRGREFQLEKEIQR